MEVKKGPSPYKRRMPLQRRDATKTRPTLLHTRRAVLTSGRLMPKTGVGGRESDEGREEGAHFDPLGPVVVDGGEDTGDVLPTSLVETEGEVET